LASKSDSAAAPSSPPCSPWKTDEKSDSTSYADNTESSRVASTSAKEKDSIQYPITPESSLVYAREELPCLDPSVTAPDGLPADLARVERCRAFTAKPPPKQYSNSSLKIHLAIPSRTTTKPQPSSPLPTTCSTSMVRPTIAGQHRPAMQLHGLVGMGSIYIEDVILSCAESRISDIQQREGRQSTNGSAKPNGQGPVTPPGPRSLSSNSM
jgi:hypothetical protein